MKTSQKGMSSILLVLIIVIVIGAGWYIYSALRISSDGKPTFSAEINTSTSTSKDIGPVDYGLTIKPSEAPDRKGYPFIEKGQTSGPLSIYFFDTKQFQTVNESADAYMFSGIGFEGISPDKYKTAFVTAKDVKILTHGSWKVETIYIRKENETIQSVHWSPQGKKLFFQVDTISPSSEMQEGGANVLDVAYKVYDTQTKETKNIPAVPALSPFLDDSHLVVFRDGAATSKMTLFDLDTFKIDDKAYTEKLGFLSPKTKDQGYGFVAAGDYVGFSEFVNIHSGSEEIEVILGNLKTKKYVRVNPKGTFVSSFNISPDAKYVVYMQRVSMDKGIPTDDLMLYEVATGKSRKIDVDQRPYSWIDNSSLIVNNYNYDSGVQITSVLNVETGQKEVLQQTTKN